MKTKKIAHESFIETALVLSQYGEFEKAKTDFLQLGVIFGHSLRLEVFPEVEKLCQ